MVEPGHTGVDRSLIRGDRCRLLRAQVREAGGQRRPDDGMARAGADHRIADKRSDRAGTILLGTPWHTRSPIRITPALTPGRRTRSAGLGRKGLWGLPGRRGLLGRLVRTF